MKNFFYILLRNCKQEKKVVVASCVILICFFIISGSIFLGYGNIVQISKNIFHFKRYSVFLEKSITVQQKEAIDRVLKQYKADKITWISPSEGRKRLIQSLPKSKKMILKFDLDYLPLVVSFSLDQENDLQLINKLKTLPGISEVYTGRETASQVNIFFLVAHSLGGLFLFILVISVCLILYNTTRFMIYTQAKELHVFKQLGASKYFIFIPLLAQVIIIFTIAYCISLLILYVLLQFVIALVTTNKATFILHQQSSFFSFSIIGYSFCAFLILSLLMSYIALHNQYDTL